MKLFVYVSMCSFCFAQDVYLPPEIIRHEALYPRLTGDLVRNLVDAILKQNRTLIISKFKDVIKKMEIDHVKSELWLSTILRLNNIDTAQSSSSSAESSSSSNNRRYIFPTTQPSSQAGQLPPIFPRNYILKRTVSTQTEDLVLQITGLKGLVGDLPLEIQDMLNLINHHPSYEKVGAQEPFGILLHGPTGTGKTMLVKALADEIGAELIYSSAAEFMHNLVGTGPASIRKLFEKAEQFFFQGKRVIVFIDEIDVVAQSRSVDSDNRESERTLSQLLTLMDGKDLPNGFKKNVKIFAATNRFEMIDSALLRPGRFDEKLKIDLPNTKKRKSLVEYYLNIRPRYMQGKIDLDKLAERTKKFNCAELTALVNKAALFAARKNRGISQEDFECAIKDIESSRSPDEIPYPYDMPYHI